MGGSRWLDVVNQIRLFNIIGGSERSERPRRQQKHERSERPRLGK
tara:strand:+ start:147564 stop:147698 length:135 start_codon:yes stop_codon:yes gene_type:complete